MTCGAHRSVAKTVTWVRFAHAESNRGSKLLDSLGFVLNHRISLEHGMYVIGRGRFGYTVGVKLDGVEHVVAKVRTSPSMSSCIFHAIPCLAAWRVNVEVISGVAVPAFERRGYHFLSTAYSCLSACGAYSFDYYRFLNSVCLFGV